MMSRVELEGFVADVKVDPRLQEEPKERGSGIASVVEIARSRGYEITTDDVRDYVRAQHRDLTEQELDAVTGGVFRTGMMGGGMQMMGFPVYRRRKTTCPPSPRQTSRRFSRLSRNLVFYFCG
jgi:predicted ribosomally synthesized peptide with nif11-like leader